MTTGPASVLIKLFCWASPWRRVGAISGPQSAGTMPGPASYGAGGPLTLTDVNLLLGRLDPEAFEIPIDRAPAEERFEALHAELERRTGSPAGTVTSGPTTTSSRSAPAATSAPSMTTQRARRAPSPIC